MYWHLRAGRTRVDFAVTHVCYNICNNARNFWLSPPLFTLGIRTSGWSRRAGSRFAATRPMVSLNGFRSERTEPGWASEEESGWKSRIPAGKVKNSLIQPRYRARTGGSRWLQGCRRLTSCWEQLRCATHSPLTKQDTPARTCASPVMHVPAPRPGLLAHTHTYMHNFAGRCDHPIPARTSILAGIASTTRCKTWRWAKVCRGVRRLDSAVWRTVWQGRIGCRIPQ